MITFKTLDDFKSFFAEFITLYSPIVFYSMGVLMTNLVEETYKKLLIMAFSGLVAFLFTTDITHLLISSFFFIYSSLTFQPQEKRSL